MTWFCLEQHILPLANLNRDFNSNITLFNGSINIHIYFFFFLFFYLVVLTVLYCVLLLLFLTLEIAQLSIFLYHGVLIQRKLRSCAVNRSILLYLLICFRDGRCRISCKKLWEKFYFSFKIALLSNFHFSTFIFFLCKIIDYV